MAPWAIPVTVSGQKSCSNPLKFTHGSSCEKDGAAGSIPPAAPVHLLTGRTDGSAHQLFGASWSGVVLPSGPNLNAQTLMYCGSSSPVEVNLYVFATPV